MPEPLVRAHDTWVLQLEKADPRVNYRMVAAGAAERCGNCRYYNAMELSCNLVEGSISSSCGCDLWTAQMSDGMMWSEKDAKDHPFSVFVDASSYLSKFTGEFKTGWIPFLPTPGKFNHPLYGEIVITPETNQAMVDSVRNHVYQEHIPLDAEHETKLSGAVAWIKDMRLNSNGSADAYVEWTDRGKALIEAGAYKYISPEWFDSWRDPATGVVHKNVIAGGAITTRPFFKDQVLRALVASEDGSTIIKQEDTPVLSPDPKVKGATDPEPEPAPVPTPPDPTPEIKFTEVQEAAIAKRVADAVAEAAKKATDPVPEPAPTPEPTPPTGFAERLTAAEARATAAEETAKTLSKTLTEVTNRERSKRFTDLVAGIGGANDGGPWAGDAAKHVTFLEQLADKVGETDPMFVSFVEQQNAAAAQIREAGLFSEAGSSATPAGNDPDAKLETLARARMAANAELTHAKAMTEVLETPEGAKLYQESQTPRRA